jgi:AbrB family looped-hinge helix DNA binding protein
MKAQAYNTPTTVKLGVSRQVVIPKKLHDRLGLKPGDYLEVEEQQGKVVMTPKTLVDKRVQAAFEESMDDFKNGRYSGPFDTVDEATASLHKAAGARRARKAKRK